VDTICQPVSTESPISEARAFTEEEKVKIALISEIMTPDGYAEKRLGLKLHPTQRKVIQDLFKPGSRLVVRCSNEVGKTQVMTTAAILYAIEIRNAMVVSTAGVFRQVSDQLIPSLKRFSHLFDPKLWAFQDSSIKKYDAKSRTWTDAYVGFSASDEHGFQGFHSTADRPLLIIIDEAQGVANDIFRAAEDRCNPTWFMACGSPGDPSGTFYEMETSQAKHYTHHKLTRLECLKENGYWLDREAITRLIEKHGETNPFIQSTVFGNFSESVEDAMISLTEYDRCFDNPPTFLKGTNQIHGFCDFAAGRDKNCFALRVGNRVEIKRKWVQRDTMSAVGEFLSMFVEARKEHGLDASMVSGDADGLGLPMVQRMRELDWAINEFHGGAAERFRNGYRNKIAEAWGEGIKKIKACQVILPDDPDLKAQILGRKGKHNSSGQLEIEKKEEYKKRCGSSPDEADAFFGCLMPPPQVQVFNLNTGFQQRNIRQTRPWEEVLQERSPDGRRF